MDNVINIDNFFEKPLPRHGSSADRGSADAYYGRAYDPHFYEGASMQSVRVEAKDMTQDELMDYHTAYHNQDDRKDWG